MARRAQSSPGAVLPLLVLQLVADVAVEHPDAEIVPLMAVALMGERFRMVARGMVAEGGEDVIRMCFLGRWNRAEEAVVWLAVWLGVWQHVESGTEGSFLIKIDPPRAVENVSWRLKYPRDGRRWKEAIYTIRK